MKVWFTKGLSSTMDAVSLVRGDPLASDIHLVGSHTDLSHPLKTICSEFIVEPPHITDDDYPVWLYDTAMQHKIDHVIGQRKPRSLWSAIPKFAGSGIGLHLPAKPETLTLLDNKLDFQTDLNCPELQGAGVFCHAALQFTNLAEFDLAWDQLSTDESYASGLCVKPVTGIFGSGFRRLDTDGKTLERLMSNDPGDLYRLPLDAFRLALSKTTLQPQMILMPYLKGPERSIDFVARDGELIVAVARVKRAKVQILETNGPAIDIARVLAHRYRLNGLCNLQTRESGGRQIVLEINARMSGGMAMACLAGVNLPLIAILSATRQPYPAPDNLQNGLAVSMVETARIVG